MVALFDMEALGYILDLQQDLQTGAEVEPQMAAEGSLPILHLVANVLEDFLHGQEELVEHKYLQASETDLDGWHFVDELEQL